MFHGGVNYVKLQVKYIRRILEGDYESLDKFGQFLMTNLKTWKAFQITPWLNNDPQSKSLRGEHTKEFTKSTHKICEQLKKLRSNRECHNFCDALYAYEKINCFLSFIFIDDYKTANALFGHNIFTANTERKCIGEKMLKEFERLVTVLYDLGMKTFLTDVVLGDHETFYAHAMRWYFVALLKRTYAKFDLGLGAFSKEGFEAINYMTKRIIRDHSNRRGNICAQTMVRIVLAYVNHVHDVQIELSERDKAKEKLLNSIKRIHHFYVQAKEQQLLPQLLYLLY